MNPTPLYNPVTSRPPGAPSPRSRELAASPPRLVWPPSEDPFEDEVDDWGDPDEDDWARS